MNYLHCVAILIFRMVWFQNERQQAEKMFARVNEICFELWPSSIQLAESRPSVSAKQAAIAKVRLAVTPSRSSSTTADLHATSHSSSHSHASSEDRKLNPFYCSIKVRTRRQEDCCLCRSKFRTFVFILCVCVCFCFSVFLLGCGNCFVEIA